MTPAPFWRRVVQAPVSVVLAGFILFSEVIDPLYRPAIRWLAGLGFVAQLSAAIRRLGPYPSLVVLLVPMVVLEPFKLGALYWMGTGHLLTGTAALVLCHLFSLIFVERLFLLVKPQLMTLGWFAAVWGWFARLRDRVVGWLRSTWAWTTAHTIGRAARAAASRILAWFRRSRPEQS